MWEIVYAVGICAISQRFGGRFFWHFFWHLNLQGWSTVNRQMAAWSSWLLFVLLHFSKYIKIMMFAFMCTLYTVQLYRKPNKYTKIQIRGWWWGKGLVAMSSMPLNLQSSSTFGLNVCVFSRWWEPGHHWFFTPKYKLWGTRRLLIFTREHIFVLWSGSCVTELWIDERSERKLNLPDLAATSYLEVRRVHRRLKTLPPWTGIILGKLVKKVSKISSLWNRLLEAKTVANV